MYAIVEIGGQQHKVQKSGKIYVNRLTAKEGDRLEFDRVLLVDKDGDIKVGLPLVEGTRVAVKVLSHVKDDKVLVFKKKRRKGYKRLNGHRQYLTQLLIEGILGEGEVLEVMEEKIEAHLQEEANAEENQTEENSNGIGNEEETAGNETKEETVEVEEVIAKEAQPVQNAETAGNETEEETLTDGEVAPEQVADEETGADEEDAPVKKKKKPAAKKKKPATEKKKLLSFMKTTKKKKKE